MSSSSSVLDRANAPLANFYYKIVIQRTVRIMVMAGMGGALLVAEAIPLISGVKVREAPISFDVIQ